MSLNLAWVSGLSFLHGGVDGAVKGALSYGKWVLIIDVLPVLLLVLNFRYGYTHSLSWGFFMMVWSVAYANSCSDFLYQVGDEVIGCDNSQAVWNVFLTVAKIVSFVGVMLAWIVLLPIQDWHWIFHIVLPGIAIYASLILGTTIGAIVASPLSPSEVEHKQQNNK